MPNQNIRSSDLSANLDSPDLARLFPDADHRWLMGLHSTSAAMFFKTRDRTGGTCAERARSLATNPDEYSALTPEAEPALHETVELAESFGVSIDRTLDPLEQMFALGRAWEADFVWMHATPKAPHCLIGGVLCFPSFWSIREKLGKPMRDVHEPVPGLNDTLGHKIETFLSTLAPHVAWGREIAGYSRDSLLNHHPSGTYRSLDATVTIDEIRVRLEHQLLMKLPSSGSILFGIRVEILPLSRVVENPQIAAGLIRALTTMSPAAAAYKGVTHARQRIIELIQTALAVQ